ncbi:MAG: LysR family transcriptional regulator [Alcaligenaceae bacterium]|nr:MAG: LysR family transcriptional regulator [Alcaligenaceae bacterium]
MSHWTEYEFFVRVVELGSLSKAAESMGLSNPSASRQLAALERRLGARLIERSTRRLYVTDIGQDFYRRCKGALDDMQEAVEAVNVNTSNPVGLLRVTASLSLSLQHITPLLPEFARRYPNLRVEVVAANRYYDIIDNNIDVALRTREAEPDSSLVVRSLATTRRVLAASPAYLDLHGAPHDPHALAKHPLLLYTYHDPDTLTFQRGDERVTIPTKATLEANDGQILRVAAVQGLGIVAQPVYVVYDDLVAGRLVPIMTDWKLPSLSVNIVYQHRRLVPAKTRAFIDFLVDDFQRQDYQRRWESMVSGQTAQADS